VTQRTRGIFFVLVTVLLLLPCLPAQVMPQLTPFSADMQFTSNRMGGSTQTMTGKMYVGQGNMRMDLTSGPQGNAVMITNFTTKTTDALMPDQHMYMEFKADQMMARRGMGPNISSIPDPNNPCANQQGATCKNLGVEQVNGRSCVHWQVTDKNGKVGNVWIDQQLHFPIKATDGDSTWELSNIKEGAPAASLFQIPDGYQKMDLGGMMQGMRPPQQ
jgi:hypothetical protein